MKIGILTLFHKNANYGGVLQAYALCKYLNDNGYSASQIVYNAKSTNLEESLTVKTISKKIIKRIRRKLNRGKNSEIKRRMESLFIDFRNQVPHTQNEYTKENIANVVNEFDIVVAGSDQIWNPKWFDSTYMLDFMEDSSSKVVYAASMGVDKLTESQQEIFRKHLSGINNISVREKECANVLSEVIGKNVGVSVDPTLLLSTNDWDLVASKRKIKEKYLFLYMLGNDVKARKIAEEFAKEKGLELVFIPDLLGEYRKVDRKINGKMVLDATPNDFISLIKHAEYIFTDSFHASVFSLLYNKEFFAFDRVGGKKTSSRLRNLTEMFECSNRFRVTDEDRDVNNLLKCTPIDYSKEHKLFEEEKQKSMDYLKASLQKA